jgi:hypothetical protein
MKGTGRQLTAAVLISGMSVAMFNALPVVVGGLAEGLKLDNERLGTLVSGYFAGHFVMTLLAPILVRRINWRIGVTTATLCASVLLWRLSTVQDYYLLMMLMGLVGLCGGVAYVIVMTFVGSSDTPARNYGLAFLAQLSTGMVLVYLLPIYVTPNWGFQGIALVLAGLFVIGSFLAFSLPDGMQKSAVTRGGDKSRSSLLLLAGCAVFFAGTAGAWAFFERIGTAAGLESQYVATVLAGSLAAGGAASILTIILDDKIGYRLPIAAGALIVILATWNLYFGITVKSFAVSILFFQFSWVFVINYMSGAIAASDKSGRYYPMVPAALGAGTIVGPMIAGNLLGTSLSLLIVFIVFTALTSSVLFAVMNPGRHFSGPEKQ